MWTDAGVQLLIANFPPPGCVIGLYTAGAGQPEMIATRGIYRRLPAAAQWQAHQNDGAWVLAGPEVVFTGLVSRAPAVGFLLCRGGGTVLCWAPFADGAPRTLIDEADRLIVTPQLLFRMEA